jgi:RHS repeat-associated protein
MGVWSFGYDSLNRLTAAASATNAPAPYAGNYGCWSYDAFGNRTAQAVSTTPCANNPPLTSWANFNANNRFTSTSQAPGGIAYDTAGNVTNDSNNLYLYDGEGRICAVQSTPVPGFTTMTGYLYGADGTRVAKGSITSMSCDPSANGFQTTKDYILGPSGEQVTEMAMDANNSMAWQHTNVWAAGKLLATYDPDGLHFYLNDPLGTRRAQTDYAGVIEQTCASLPFGDGESCLPTPTEHLFTGKERDTESGNDYFGARYYASSMGRFMSPDPSQLYYADPTNPQSLNLYSYVLNNPLINIDPTGEECVWDDDSFDSKDEPDTGNGDKDPQSHAAKPSANEKCHGLGGTWIDPKAFATLNAGDWSNQANANIAGIAQQLNGSSTTVSVTAQDPGVVGALPLAAPPQIQEFDPAEQLAIGVTINTGNLSQGLQCATEAGLAGVASYLGVSRPTPNPARQVATTVSDVLAIAGKEGFGAAVGNTARVFGPTVAKAFGAFAAKNATKFVPVALAAQGVLAANDAINAYNLCNR